MEFVRQARDSLRQSKDKFCRSELVLCEIRITLQHARRSGNLTYQSSIHSRAFSTFPRCGLLRRGRLRRRLWYAALLRLVLRSVRRRGTRIIGWSRTAFAIEQRERRQAPIEHKNQTTSVDLRNLPAADIVADLHARDLCRARTNDGARAFAVYHDTEQRHVRW